MPRGGFGEASFELGDWRVEPARGVISPTIGGAETRLELKLMDLLLCFAGSPGRVLSKDEIVGAVWSGRVIGDDTLAAALSRLRRALGETPQSRYIETLPKRGYRLIATSQSVGRAADGSLSRDAADALARGHAAMASPLGLAQARLYFEAAAKAAPGSAAAHAGLAEALIAEQMAGGGEGLALAAKAEARAATQLDDNFAAGWSALGLALLLADRVFEPADEAMRRAVSLDPALPSIRRRRAFALTSVGRFVEAEREARKALSLDPVSLPAHADLLQLLIAARRYGPALSAARAALALSPSASEAWYARGWAHVFAGDEPAGVEALLKGLELWGVGPAALDGLRALHAGGGFAALCAAGADLFEAPGLLFRPKATDVAILRAAAGQADAAFAALETAARHDDPLLMLLPWLPHFDALRPDPRFERLLGRVRLVR
ncbi:MAG TPA: winged helix-turn-helix domain-containing protein [Caulobacteraceae bacterium]|jgi:DNA-binding winged helix-turn-helix (wHTH) protein|nr:winged helix-turn-helix domain-containing protein [Caulobacteraceae bacterium]